MTRAEIRDAWNELSDAFDRSSGEAQKYLARHILRCLRAHPWLLDDPDANGIAWDWEKLKALASGLP